MYRNSLVALVFFWSTPAMAQQPLSADLSNFEPLIGTWACVGQNSPTPQSPAFEFESQFRFESALMGNFVKVTYSETIGPSLQTPRDNVEYWNAANGTFTSTFFNAFGQRGELSSAGVLGDRLTWTGTIDTPNGPLPFEGRIELLAQNHLTVVPTLILPDGSEFHVAMLDCAKPD